jgi:HlyD family secretion protein
MKKLLFVICLAWAGGAAGVWYYTELRPRTVNFRTARINRGDLLATINATGTLEPEEVVDVCALVSGEVLGFGPDPKDDSKTIGHGALVEPGTPLLRLDDKLFVARMNQAKANVSKAEADIEAARVKVTQTGRELDRVQRLAKSRSVSAQESDAAFAEAESAKAALSVAQSAITLAKANLEEAQVNFSYTTIKSPVKGVIVDRRVNLGQIVTASASAPSLFLIAKDLSRMQIWASVNETDVGQIHPGQRVRFSVAAFPKDTFYGKVDQIRLNASMTQSVVTYTVVVVVENNGGKLLPYLTARLQFEVEERHNALLAPNGALRWTPVVHHVAPAYRSEFTSALRQKAAVGDRSKTKTAATSDKGYVSKGTVWVRDGEFVRPLSVTLGLTDGIATELIGEEVPDGSEVVVGLASNEDEMGASPFIPQIKNDKVKK